MTSLCTRLAILTGLLAFVHVPARAAGSYGISPDEKPQVVGTDVEYLGTRVGELKDAVASVNYSDNDIHARAAALFGRIASDDTTYGGAVRLRGWSKPKIHTAAYRKRPQEDISIDGMSQSVYKTMMASDVPPPEELMNSFVYGEEMKANGLKNYDDDSMLGNGQLGVYMYKGADSIAIFFNKMLRNVQDWVGNEFAAATDVHESAHTRDHGEGKLNPIEVRKGETLAYKTEYLWLNMMDPTGEKLSWARATLGKFAKGPNKAPEFVGEYLEHLAMIRDYGNRDDFYGLVAKLGYQDRHNHPGHGHEEPGDDAHAPNHDDDEIENAERPDDGYTERPPLVRYVNFPG